MFNLNEQIDVSIDGERVAVLDLNTRMSESDPKNNLEPQTPPIQVTAGPHRVSAAFIEKFDAIPDDLVMPLENTLADVSIAQGITLLPHMRELRIIGPSTVTGVSDTPSRRRIFTCRPTTPPKRRRAPARSSAAGHAGVPRPGERRRRQGLLTFFQDGRERSDFETGIRLALQAILASPRFVFRFEEAPHDRQARTELSPDRRRPGVAAVVLPVGHSARRGAAEARQRQARCARRCSRETDCPNAGGPEGRSAGNTLCGAVAAAAGPR